MVKREVIFKNAISNIKKLKIHKQKVKIYNSVECCVVSYSYFGFNFSGNNDYTRFLMPIVTFQSPCIISMTTSNVFLFSTIE